MNRDKEVVEAVEVVESVESVDIDRARESGEAIETIRGVRRIAYWGLAGFFFLLAMVGVVLPGIPTTPFLLLMCYFLIRVSPKLHARVLAWPLVGRPLRDWREHRGVRRNVKFVACTMVILLIGSTLIWGGLPPAAKLLILCIGLYGMSVILRLPTVDSRRL